MSDGGKYMENISITKLSNDKYSVEYENKRNVCKDWEVSEVIEQLVFADKEVKENVPMNIISLIVFFGLSIAGLFWIGSLLFKLVLEVLK